LLATDGDTKRNVWQGKKIERIPFSYVTRELKGWGLTFSALRSLGISSTKAQY